MRSFTVDEVAELEGVHRETVLSLIRSRQLVAYSNSEPVTSKRPSYRVTEDALAAFRQSRSTVKSVVIAKPASGKARALAALRNCPKHYAD